MICATIERSNRPDSLCDIVDYASHEPLPEANWLTRLSLDRPRRDVRCLCTATRILKRALDIVISATALVLLAPILLIVAALVKWTSPGGVIFRQTRVGLNLRRTAGDRRQDRNRLPGGLEERRTMSADRRGNFTYGRHFTLYKFRTMREDAERQGARFAVAGDPRVTPVGRFLRKTRLDELPQLWNVLRGEMSLVGPRPERPEFIEELSCQIPNYLERLGLKPGLTGVAQVVNGYDNNLESFRRKVAFDLLYLQNCCLTNDLKIMVRTIRVVCKGQGL
jgi:lipopolysaccharide/colanic/teichoic acid biosynthesis glycosyltransferase